MKQTILCLATVCTTLATVFISCKKDDAPAAPTVVKTWNVALSAKNENPAPAGRNETGTVVMTLMSDNSLVYNISVTGLTNDTLSAAHIHVGNVITSGAVIWGFDPVFTGSTATGTITGMRSTFIDSLKNDANELYFNVHSKKVPGGLVRGQMNVGIDMAVDVPLSGANEVPQVTTTATGLALLRLTSDKKLYSKITVSTLEANDTMTLAHIHRAAAGVSGPVIIPIYGSNADFGVSKMSVLADSTFVTLKTSPVYVNTHSARFPSGILRGQIR